MAHGAPPFQASHPTAPCHPFPDLPALQVAPLHIAAALGSVELAGALLDSGAANPNAQNALGMTPLQLAVARNQPQVSRL